MNGTSRRVYVDAFGINASFHGVRGCVHGNSHVANQARKVGGLNLTKLLILYVVLCPVAILRLNNVIFGRLDMFSLTAGFSDCIVFALAC